MAFNEQVEAGDVMGAFVHKEGNESIDGVKTFTEYPIIPADPYNPYWSGSEEPATKGDVYDEMELKADDSTVVHKAGTETITGAKTFSSQLTIPDEAYGVGFNGKLEPVTKNALYDALNGMLADSLEAVLNAGPNLASNHTIDTLTFTLTINSGSGGTNPLRVTANSGIALNAYSASGEGIYAVSGSGKAVHASVTGSNPAILCDKINAATNAVMAMLDINGQTSGTAAAGLGVAQDYYLESTTGAVPNACRVQIVWTDATNATVTSKYEILLQDGGAQVRRFSLAGNGKLTLDTYGSGTHTGTGHYFLVSESGGAVVERELPKMYKAIWAQASTNAPTLVASRVNDFGGVFVPGYTSAGIYTGTLAGAFPDGDKFFPVSIMCLTQNKLLTFQLLWVDANSFEIRVRDTTGTLVDVVGRIAFYFEQYT